jgi:hypothetical protein
MVQRVLDRAAVELQERQSGLDAPEETFISFTYVVEPTLPEAEVSSKLRSAGAAMILGVIATLTATYGLESFMVARRRQRHDGVDDRKDDGEQKDPADAAGSARPVRRSAWESAELTTPISKLIMTPGGGRSSGWQ